MTEVAGTGPWPSLADDEVHLWWVPLDVDDADRASLARLLHPLERDRAGRLRVAQHRARWITGRAMLRLLLARYVREPDAARLRFLLGPKGKPRLDGGRERADVRFNYSDTGGMALYGFCRSELGVDLESLDRELRFERIVDRRFTPEEGAALRAFDGDERRRAFLRCWTRKESYGKARGLGIHYPLDSVVVCSDMSARRLRIEPTGDDMDDPRGWTLYAAAEHRGFAATVVVAGEGWTLRHFQWAGGLAALAGTGAP